MIGRIIKGKRLSSEKGSFFLFKKRRKRMEEKELNEFEARDYILEKGKKIKSLDELIELVKEVETKFNYDYGVAPRSIGAVCAVVAKYLSSSMGLSGFQASFAMWDFIFGYIKTSNKCGLRLVDFDEMLYPQYGYKFEKTISKGVWDDLQKQAKECLESPELASQSVKEHWRSIVNGVVPFGYSVEDKR
jgi:hypothetical protein